MKGLCKLAALNSSYFVNNKHNIIMLCGGSLGWCRKSVLSSISSLFTMCMVMCLHCSFGRVCLTELFENHIT